MRLDELIARLVALHDEHPGSTKVYRWETDRDYGDSPAEIYEVEYCPSSLGVIIN